MVNSDPQMVSSHGRQSFRLFSRILSFCFSQESAHVLAAVACIGVCRDPAMAFLTPKHRLAPCSVTTPKFPG